MILRLCLLFLFFATSNAFFLNEDECLNYTVYPVQYELTIIPYIFKDRSSFYDCELSITVIANVPNILMIELDAKDLEIKSGNSIQVLHGNVDIINEYRPYEYDVAKGKLYIYLKEALIQYSERQTQYNIKISFRKYIGRDSTGVFLVPYEDGGTKYMLVTRLSPDKAKYFFPCFDNPQFEAVFKFRVYVLPVNIGVQFSNTSLAISKEERRHDLKNNYVLVDYISSPQVSIYQVGFHYSQFGSRQVSAMNTNDTIVVWAQSKKLPYYDFILNFGGIIMNLIHDYAAVNRPIVYGPINIVAVPSGLDGYEPGSWNLLTNGESRLAYNPQFTSIKQEERMTFELAQQLGRIWLGNPGEMERTRWKEEWFKEGVATYLAYYLLSQYQHGALMRRKWPIGMYGLEMRNKAMAEDWHRSTPALATFNRTLAVEIHSRHKELVSMKTASILWMVENWLGSEKFHMALVKYINTRRGRFISLDDFMTNLDLDTVECLHQFFNGSTASRVLKSWFHQPGYPVIYVNVLRDRSPEVIQLKQRRFSFTHHNRRDTRYLIPISYMVQNGQNCFNCHQPRFTIEQTYTFRENLNGGWIILNRNASGYYRVNYDPVTWKFIARTLRENRMSIDEQNRAQIVNDVFALYAAGDIDHALAVEILYYLDTEDSPVVWDSVISGFELLKTDGTSCNMTQYLYKEWQDFMRSKVANIYDRLVGDIEQQPKYRLFRSNIIGLACAVQHQPCLNNLRYMYEEHKRGRSKFDPDSREACYYMLFDKKANFGDLGLNAFEVEDKRIAEDKIQKEKQFMYRIPVGKASKGELVMPSTLPPFTTPRTIVPDRQTGGGSTTNTASLAAIVIPILAMVTLR